MSYCSVARKFPPATNKVVVSCIAIDPPREAKYLDLVTVDLNGKKIEQHAYHGPFDTKGIADIVVQMDQLAQKYDARLVGDAVSVLSAACAPIVQQLPNGLKRHNVNYRDYGDGRPVWTPWLDIESLQLGFMRSSQCYMWDRDPKYDQAPHVEHALDTMIGLPPQVDEGLPVSEFNRKCAMRVAEMYAKQLKWSIYN